MTEHQQEYPSLTAAAAAVARQVGVGKESVRGWVLQAQIDDGLREDAAILKAATSFFVGELDPRNR